MRYKAVNDPPAQCATGGQRCPRETIPAGLEVRFFSAHLASLARALHLAGKTVLGVVSTDTRVALYALIVLDQPGRDAIG